MNIAEVVRRARRPERVVDLCLALDLVVEWEELDRQRTIAPSDSLAGSDSDAAAAQRMEELRALMAEATIGVRLRALSRLAYDKLLGEHPPRRDADGELLAADVGGFDASTFRPALVRACWVSPTMDPPVLTELLDEAITHRQFEDLWLGALLVNRGRIDIPFSRAASTTPPISGDE